MSEVGEANPEHELLKAGARVGRYRVVRKIGAGGMGVVYEGAHEQLRKKVAIKTLHRSVASTPAMQARFVREGEAVALIRHPNVVSVDDVGIDDGIPYLVMEYLAGRDLDQLLADKLVLTAEEAADILLPVISAVAAAHDQGIVHRDLKPANIFLAETSTGNAQPKVLDFGISKLTGVETPKLTQTNSLLGSPYYMSPEQADSATLVGVPSDVYSLGVILYQCVTANMPFNGQSVMQVFGAIAASRPPPPRTLVPSLPVELEEIILRAIRKDPAERFPTARALGAALCPFASPRVRLSFEREFSGFSATLPGAPAVEARRDRGAPDSVGARSTLGGSVAERPSETSRAPAGRTRIFGAVVAIGVIAATIMLVLGAHQRPPEPVPESTPTPAPVPAPAAATYLARIAVKPEIATITLDEVMMGRGSFERAMPKDGRAHTLRISAAGYEPQTITFQDAPPPELVTLAPLPADALPRPNVEQPAPPATASEAPAPRTRRKSKQGPEHEIEQPGGASQPPKAGNVVGTGANDSPIID